MTDLRTAAQQALEALEQSHTKAPFGADGVVYSRGVKIHEEAIAALRERLAQPAAQWVGLTDEEIKALASWWPSYDRIPALMVLARDIENSLKEKNT